MNERIKQLALQSGLVRNGDFGMKRWEGPRSDSISDQDLEKFADMIVRECIKVAVNKDSGYMHPADVAGYMAAGRSTAAHMIKQHFGVEE